MEFSVRTWSFNVSIWSFLVSSRVDIEQNILYVCKYMYVLFTYLELLKKSVSSSSVCPAATKLV